MKCFRIIFAALLAITLCACRSKEFNVTAEFPASTSRVITLTYYAAGKKAGWVTETALSVNVGKGTVKCSTIRPTLVWLSGAGKPDGPQMWFWAERGDDILISGKEDEPFSWEVSGNGINERWTKWRLANLAVLKKRETKQLNAAIAKYVKENKDDELSALLLLTIYDRSEDEAVYTRLWNSLSESARSEEVIAAAGRSDQPTGALAQTPPRIADFKLHCQGETIRRFQTRDYDAILLYFQLGDEDMHRRDIDSLKALLKEKGSAPRFALLNVSLGSDTITWLSHVRLDSLPQSTALTEAWAPGGRMHSTVLPFALPASPWFVVLDTKGNQKYRGADAGGALKATRPLIRKSAPKDSLKP